MEMGRSFHEYVRHTIECNQKNGNLTAALEKIREDLVSDLPNTDPPTVQDSDLVRQRKYALAYLDGYMQGPAPVYIDSVSVNERIDARPAPRQRKRGK